MWNNIKVEYGPFIDAYAVDAELDVWRHKIANRGVVADKKCKAMDAAYQLHPNV